MKIKELILERFGPFFSYHVTFPIEDRAVILLTGKNNAGKTTIIRSLQLLANAMKYATGSTKPISKPLLKKDVENLQIDRLIYEYANDRSFITGILDSDREIKVIVDGTTNTISCELPAYSRKTMSDLFGFIPQLGQLAEKEYLVSKQHVLNSLRTTLSPRHLRNQFYHLLTDEQFNSIKSIIKDSWEGIELLDNKLDIDTGMMNNVDISHIIHVQKDASESTTRTASDRKSLEKIRSNIGSSFNLIASQFEDVDLLLATEYQLDYDIIHRLAIEYGIVTKCQNVKISGFQNWKRCIHFKEAYSLFFGKQIKCSLLLDRDYYPPDYLDNIRKQLSSENIRVILTPGKEIENIFLEEAFIKSLIPNQDYEDFDDFIESIYRQEYDNCFPKYVEFHNEHSDDNKTYTTTYRDLKPVFDSIWDENKLRHTLIPGKQMLAKLRVFFKEKYNLNLPTALLVSNLSRTNNPTIKDMVSKLYFQ